MFFDGSSFDDVLSLGPQGAMPSLIGDYYREPDDVTRGLSLYSGAADFSQMQDFLYHKDAQMFGKAGMMEMEILGRGPTNDHRCDLQTSRFEEDCEAFPVPADTLFQLEQTTVLVNDSSAAQIGNHMLDFLGSEIAGLVTKVNRIKFTIKAKVYLDGLSCEAKVRIYRKAPDQHIVEMQRRSGDSIAFNRLFQLASQQLTACINSPGMGLAMQPDHDKGPEANLATFCTAPAQFMDAGIEATIAPILDLAEIPNPELQVEAMQALLHAAQDVNLVVQLCTPQAFLLFRNLLQLVCFSVAEPLAHLLCCLALLPEAENQFADQQFLQIMIEKVWGCATGHVASEQLARAVCHTITQHAAELSPKANRELTRALSEKLRDAAPGAAVHAWSPRDTTTINYLEESLQTLRLFEQACY